MKKHLKSMLLLVALIMIVALVACSGGNNGGSSDSSQGSSSSSSSSSTQTSTGGSQTSTPAPEAPAELETIRVSIWERGNAPQGQVITDTVMSRWINEQVAELGIQVEFVPLPRSEERDRLNTWMASGTAPDLILVYSFDVFYRYASQGGLAQLDDAIAKYGQDIMERNALAMEGGLGTYDGNRYALVALRTQSHGANLNIRKDWLDQLGLPVPDTIDELTEALYAFKDIELPDGSEVIPFGLSSFTSSQTSFLLNTAYGFGVDMFGPANYWLYPTGNIVDGGFVPDVKLPETKAHLKWLNQLFKDGIISPEFVTDLNAQQLTEDIYAGRVGLIDTNWGAYQWYAELKDDVPGVDWVTLDPLLREDGTRWLHRDAWHGMFMMVPATSQDKAEGVVKYLNWMSAPEVMITLTNGFEGEHYEVVDGVRVPINLEKRAEDFGWYSGDLAIAQQGVTPYSDEIRWQQAADQHDEHYADRLIEFVNRYDKWDADPSVVKRPPFPQYERPFIDDMVPLIGDLVKEHASRIIIADDFESAYEALQREWNQLDPNQDFEREVTAGLKEMGVIQ